VIHKRILGALGAGLLLLSGSPAMAAETEGAYTLTPMFGLYNYDTDEGVERNGASFGLGFGYYYTDQLMIEAFGVASSTDSDPAAYNMNNRVLGLGLQYSFYDLDWSWTPYLSAGAGIRWRDPRSLGSDFDRDGVVMAGGGLKHFVTDSAAIVLDGRFYRDLNSNDGEFDHGSLMLGVEILMGQKSAPVRAPIPMPAPMTEPEPMPAPVMEPEPAPPVDSDGDGVMDPDDACPGTPPGTEVDERGCAKLKAPVKMGLKVEFDFDSARLRNTDASRLDEAVAFLNQYPNAVVTIEGHTDSKGSDEYNQRLSEARAEAVRLYLIKSGGIAADRVRSVGMGEMSPIADNSTDEGRQRNRRVVAIMIEPK